MGIDKKNNKETVGESTNKITVFDDVFRTMLDKMPEVVIPVINEVFHTAYTEDEKIIHYKNEHTSKNGKIITDSCIGIQNRIYHLECQSSVDSTMTLRMIEYDFAIALDSVQKKDGWYEMEFPKSCVLYLRHNNNTPDKLQMKVNLPDGNHFNYEVPVVKVQKYTKDEIFQKKLLMFLPFYIMRYEKEYEIIESEPQRLINLIDEYEDIRNKLIGLLEEKEKSALYLDMIDMIVKISDYMLEKRELLKERIGKTMAGRVLKLFSERVAEYEENVAQYEENVAEYKENVAQYEKNVAKLNKDTAELQEKSAELQEKSAELQEKSAELQEKSAEFEEKRTKFQKENEKFQKEKDELIRQREELNKAYLYNDIKTYTNLINKKIVDLPMAIETIGISEEEFMAAVKEMGLTIE